MIEEDVIKQYPSLVARTYLMLNDNSQKKDLQKFWFENTISFLAIISAAQLVEIYNETKSKEDFKETDQLIINEIENHKSLTNIGLEHMALGKWVGMLRDTTVFLKDKKSKTKINELLDFYTNNKKTIDNFVKLRNDDAHGNPISDEQLINELAKRQKMIDKLVEQLGFLENYSLIYPESFDIQESKEVYLCKIFEGSSVITSEISDFKTPPEIGNVILLNQKTKEYLNLSPLILYLGIQDSEKNFLGIFSKFTKTDKSQAKYLNLDGNAEINLLEFGKDKGINVPSQRIAYNAIYSDPESYQVNLDLKLDFEDESIKKDEKSNLNFSLKNYKSVDIFNVKVIFDVPKQICFNDNQELKSFDFEYTNNQIIFTTDLVENDFDEAFTLEYSIDSQGLFSLKNGTVFYDYYKTDSDKENGVLTSEELEFTCDEIMCIDPNSRDKLQPVINIKKKFINHSDIEVNNVKIGEDFIFELEVKNIGFSSAKNISIDIVMPQNVNLKEGKETIQFKQLNPFESRSFQYVLTSKTPGIYTIAMQNIIYSDIEDNRYTTRLSDDYFMIVKSDLKKEFVYSIKDHIEDLYIDNEEKQNIRKMIDDINSNLNIKGKELYEKSETETVINIIRDLIKKIAKKSELTLLECVYEEGRADKKITNSEQRKFLVFTIDKFPFFAINLTKGYNPEFFAINCYKIQKNPVISSFIEKRHAIVAKGAYTLDNCIDFSKIKYDKNFGINFFKTWINMLMTKIKSQHLIWAQISGKISDLYSTELQYSSGTIRGTLNDINSQNESGVQGLYTFLDRVQNRFFISFEVTGDIVSTKNFKTLINIELDKNLVFLKNKSSKTRCYDSEQLSFWHQTDDSSTRQSKFPSIKVNQLKIDSIDNFINTSKILWNKLCLVQSLNLLDNEEFSKIKNIELIKEYTYKLFEKGFALRENKKEKRMLDIYPLNGFKPGAATDKDCIGFIEKSYSNAVIYLDFFEDNIDMALTDKITLVKSAFVTEKVRWLKVDVKDDEDLKLVFDTILLQSSKFSPNILAIWPKILQKQMILDHGQSDSGFFILLKCLANDINNYDDIKNEFLKLNIENELDRTIKQCNNFDLFAGYESPIIVEKHQEGSSIEISSSLKDTLLELKNEDPEFNFLEKGGNALRRIKIRSVVLKSELLNSRTPDSYGDVGYNLKGFKDFSNIWCACWIKKDFKRIATICKFDNLIDSSIIDTILEKFEPLINEYELICEITGHKKNHYKLVSELSFNDIDDDMQMIQDYIQIFFEKVIKIAEDFRVDHNKPLFRAKNNSQN